MLATDLQEKSDNMVDGSVTIQLPVAEQARLNRERADTYHRFHIDAKETEDRQKIPRRFNVKVGKFGVAKLLFTEFFKSKRWFKSYDRKHKEGVLRAESEISPNPLTNGVKIS